MYVDLRSSLQGKLRGTSHPIRTFGLLPCCFRTSLFSFLRVGLNESIATYGLEYGYGGGGGVIILFYCVSFVNNYFGSSGEVLIMEINTHLHGMLLAIIQCVFLLLNMVPFCKLAKWGILKFQAPALSSPFIMKCFYLFPVPKCNEWPSFYNIAIIKLGNFLI